MNRCHALSRARLGAFTLVEILISIMILALGLLGLGVLFPVVIREQRIGVDASTGVVVAGAAKDMLTTPRWGLGLPKIGTATNPLLTVGDDGSVATDWMWSMLRDREASTDFNSRQNPIPDGLGKGFNTSSPASSQVNFSEGQWFTRTVEPTTGVAKIGFPNKPAMLKSGPPTVTLGTTSGFTACVDLPVQQRLFPQSATVDPQFVWDFAVQRVPTFNFFDWPDVSDLRAVIFVRRVDPRIRLTGTATSVLDAITNFSGTVAAADRRLPLGEDANGNPTFDGTNGAGGLKYSGIHTCEVEFWYNPANPAMNHPDRLYIPNGLVDGTLTSQLPLLFAQMKQPGQKLVDNLGNIYTVIGSGNEPGVAAQSFDGVAGGDYIRVDPPISVDPDRSAFRTQMTGYSGNGGEVRRAIWSVSFTPQVPVAVTIFDLLKGAR